MFTHDELLNLCRMSYCKDISNKMQQEIISMDKIDIMEMILDTVYEKILSEIECNELLNQ